MLRALSSAVAVLIPTLCVGQVLALKQANDKPMTIPADFTGISFETKRILADESYPGHHLFSPENSHLVALFKTLGIHSLRIGGNTADRANVPMPETADIDALFSFAQAADTKVIYTLRMKDTAPETVAPTAKYIYARYARNLSHFVVGNEPNVYFKTFDAYESALAAELNVLTAAVPQAEFCGPCTTNGAPTWPAQLARSLPSKNLTLLTQHNYPAGNGQKATDPKAAIDKLLSDLSPAYVKLLQQLQDGKHTLPIRLEETNNFYLGGAPHASDTFASALWALDYLHWWAAHGLAGMNFHASDYYPKTPDDKAVWYVPFSRAAADGKEPAAGGEAPMWEVHPLGYAIKAFTLATPSGAKTWPVSLEEAGSGAAEGSGAVTAYGTQTGQTRFLTIINRSPRAVQFQLPAGLKGGRRMALAAPSVDATTGVTLGGKTLSPAGAFEPVWTALPGGEGTVSVEAPSALLVRFDP